MTLLTQKKSYGKALSLHRILVAFFIVAIMLLSYRLKILQSCGEAPESQAIDSLLDHNALQIWDHSNLDLQGHSLAASLSIDELCFQKVTECGNSAKLLIAAGKFRPLAAINGVMTNSEGIDFKTRQPTANIINESFLGRPGEFLLNLWQSINLMWRNIDL